MSYSQFSSSQDLDQLLSHSFTEVKLHRSSKTRLLQAAKVYGRSPQRSTAPSSKSTLRLNTTLSHIHSRLPSASQKSLKSEAASPVKPRPPSTRFLTDLRSATITCRSDFLDLQRDISTYEHFFLQSTTALPELSQVSTFIPRVIVQTDEVKAEAAHTLQVLNRYISALSQVAQERNLQHQRTFKRVNYQIKQETDQVKPRILFRGVRQISNLHVLLRVYSNGWLTFFDIQAQLLDGTALNLRLSHGLEGLTADLSQKERSKRLNLMLFQRLYVGVTPEGLLLLCYNGKHAEEFHMFPVKVAGIGYVPILISASGLLNLPNIDPISFQLPINISSVAHQISRQLHFHQNSFHWYDAHSHFTSKESESLLMDPKYVTEKLGSSLTQATLISQFEVNSLVFSVMLHSKANVERVTVFRGEEGREADLNLLKSLQFPTLSLNWTTFLRSLELKYCVKRVFPEFW